MSARTAFLVQQEQNKIVAHLANTPGSTYRAVTSVTKKLLLDAPYFYNGHHIDPVAKSLGAGVWEISNKKEQ